jgi:hypothetical protein
MHYYAKLAVGGFYKVFGKIFLRGVEHAVDEKEYDYLKTLVDKRLIDQGATRQIINVPLFTVRTEELTTQEKVMEEIQDAPDSLRPKRRKEAE